MFSTNIPERIDTNTILVKPSAGHTAFESVVEPFYAVGGALGAIPGIEAPKTRQMFKERLDAIQQDLSNPQIGLAQKGGDWIANIAGGTVATAPAFAAAGLAIEGAVGAGAYALAPVIARPVLSLLRTPIAKLSKSALADWLPQSTIGEFAKHTGAYVAGYKAAVLPEHVMDTYDKISDTYNLKKAGEATLNDNIGMLIGIIPFAAGHILLKSYTIAKSVAAAQGSGSALARELVLNREQKQSALTSAMTNAKTAVDKERAHSAILQAHMDVEQHNFKVVDHAVATGRLPEEDGKWYHDYIKDPDAHEHLAPNAHKILQQEQVPYDRVSGRVWQKLLLPEDIKNHNSTVADAITSDVSGEYKDFMSNYVLHNRLDMVKQEWNEKPVLAGGSQGFVDYVNKKMLGKNEALSRLDSHLDKHMTIGLKKNKLPMSQNRIFQHLKKQRMLAPEAPYAVPGRVAHKLELNRKYQRAIRAKAGRYTPEQVDKFKTDAKSFKLLNPAEELDSIRSRLITDKGLVKGFQHKRPYHRLNDLAELYPQAEMLLRRIHDEHEYAKQEQNAQLLEKFVKFVDSSVSKLAKPENVVKYLKDRIESQVPDIRNIEPATKIMQATDTKVESIKKSAKAIEVNPEILVEQEAVAKKSKAEEAKADFKASKDRFEQFKEREIDLDQFINCLEGTK